MRVATARAALRRSPEKIFMDRGHGRSSVFGGATFLRLPTILSICMPTRSWV
jgi:hypothetical protein